MRGEVSSPGDKTRGLSTGPVSRPTRDCRMRELQLARVLQFSWYNPPQEEDKECGSKRWSPREIQSPILYQ